MCKRYIENMKKACSQDLNRPYPTEFEAAYSFVRHRERYFILGYEQAIENMKTT